jgi:hypothetical protein
MRWIKQKNPANDWFAGFLFLGTFCGAGGNRTRVQTPDEKAFYMLIPLLFVGNDQGSDKPNQCLARWS